MSEHEHEFEDERIITLTDDNGDEFEFELLGEVEVDGQEYFVMLPIEEEEEIDEAIIFKVIKDEQGEIISLEEPEDDEEWEKVADAWKEMLENEDAE